MLCGTMYRYVFNNAFLSEVHNSRSCGRDRKLGGERNHKREERRSPGTPGGDKYRIGGVSAEGGQSGIRGYVGE